MKRFTILSILVIILLAGCQPAAPEATLTATVTPTSLPTTTPTPTITLTPTLTFTPTQTFTPTITPTLAFPLQVNTPIPSLSASISIANASGLVQIAKYTQAPEKLVRVSQDGKVMVVATTNDIDLFDGSGNLFRRLPYHLVFNIDVGGLDESDLDISADGSRLALVDTEGVKVVSSDGDILFSEPVSLPTTGLTGVEKYFLRGTDTAISSSGDLVVVAADKVFKVVRLSDKQVLYDWNLAPANLHGHKPRFSRDGSVLGTQFGDWDEAAWIWSTSDWKALQHFPTSEGALLPWAISPDGKYYATFDRNSLTVMDIATRIIKRKIDFTNPLPFIPPFFSPNSQLVGVIDWTGSDTTTLKGGVLRTWNIEKGDPVNQQTLNLSFDFYPVYGGANNYSRLYWSPPVTLKDNGEAVQYTVPSLADNEYWDSLLATEFKPQMNLVDGSGMPVYMGTRIRDHTFALKNADTGKQLASINWTGYDLFFKGIDLENHVLAYTIRADPTTYQGCYIYDLEKNRVAYMVRALSCDSVVYSSAHHTLAIFLADMETSFLFDHGTFVSYDTGEILLAGQVQTQWLTLGGFSPDGSMIVELSRTGGLLVMNAASPFKIRKIPFSATFRKRPTWPVSILSDNSLMATVVTGDNSEKVALVNLADGTIVYQWSPFDGDQVKTIEYSNDEKLVKITSLGGWTTIWGLYP